MRIIAAITLMLVCSIAHAGPKLYFCTPGNDRDRKAFWDEVEALGLLPVARVYEQINAPFGRNRDNEQNWPEEWASEEDLASLRQRTMWQARGSLGRYAPRAAEAAYIDLEPRRYDENGRPIAHWMMSVTRRGLLTSEEPAVLAMLGGVRDHTGVSLSYYNLPRMTKGQLKPRDYQNMIRTRGFYAEHLDHVQVNLYPFGDERDDLSDPVNLFNHAVRANEHFQAVSLIERPAFAMLWLKQFMEPAEFKRHAEMTVVISLHHTEHIAFWVECTSERNVELAIERLRLIAPFLRGIGFEEVE